MKAVVVLLILGLAAVAEAANWAVLVAGSNTYGNYRHQSDVYDMYQILHMNGIPDANIVVMQYDDIANNPSNPKKGEVFNWPGGPDVYKGSLKDYTGNDVTPANFLAALTGKATNKKAIHPTADDNVFVFYTDHGAPGFVAFPAGGSLHATDLNKALKEMADGKKFKKMVFYLEACESGSMFNKILTPNERIYALTASDPTESSWACDYDNTVRAYLNDCFSINFMLDTRKHDTGGYTLDAQYQAVKAQTSKSHACQYGDLSFQKDEIALYMGKAKGFSGIRQTVSRKDAVDARMVAIATLEKRMVDATPAERAALRVDYENEILKLKRADRIFLNLRSKFNSKEFRPTNDVCTQGAELDHECMKAATDAVYEQCNMDDYMLANMKHVAKFCNAGLDIAAFRSVLKEVCA